MSASDTVSSATAGTLAPARAARKPDKLIAAVSVLTFLICCAAWAWFATIFPETGWDFTEFYLAGRVPPGSLYDQQVFRDYGERLLRAQGTDYYPPYVRPAIFALLLRPLMQLPYWPAYWIFAGLQLAACLAAFYLLHSRFAVPVELLPGLGLFYPAMMGIVTGQDSNSVALLLTASLILLLDGNDRAGGVVLALCLYKFNLALLIPVLLLIKRRFVAFQWFCGAGVVLAAGSALVAPPNQYLALLQNISSYTIGFSPDKMIGVRALAYGLGQPWLFYPFAALVAGASIWAMRRLSLRDSFGVAILGALLCSYHVNWYDGAVLVVPLMAAFGSRVTLPKLAAAPLLFAFPVWAAFHRLTAVLILLLLCAFVVPAIAQQSSATTEPV
ncbi:MAG TPA: glycosyltransferase family 87 protein [Terriglobales bacterium]|jgi:hypothetical protein